jgi:SOS-response transcriptional repressor LexA
MTAQDGAVQLTGRQGELLKFLLTFGAEKGRWPRRREVAARFGWASLNAVHSAYRALAAKGLIAWSPRLAGGLRVPGCRFELRCDGSAQGRFMQRLLQRRNFGAGAEGG